MKIQILLKFTTYLLIGGNFIVRRYGISIRGLQYSAGADLLAARKPGLFKKSHLFQQNVVMHLRQTFNLKNNS